MKMLCLLGFLYYLLISALLLTGIVDSSKPMATAGWFICAIWVVVVYRIDKRT